MIASAIGFFCLILGALLAGLAKRTDPKDNFAVIRLFGLAFLVCMLIQFRLKPYTFGTLIPFAIAAIAFPVNYLRYIGYAVMVVAPFWIKHVV